jgi:signal transduction histidine kinase
MLIELILLLLTNVVALIVVLIGMFASNLPALLRSSLIVTVLSLLFWQEAVFISNHIQANVVFWDNFLFVWPTLAGVSFFIFTYNLNEHKRWKVGQAYKVAEWALAVIVGTSFLWQIITLGLGHIYVLTDGQAVRGSGYPFYLVGLLVELIAIIVYLLLSVIATRRLSQRTGIRAVFITVVAAVVFGLCVNVLLPLVTQSQTFAWLGSLTIDIFSIGFALSVIRGRLLNVKFYAVRTVAYILSLATLAALYGLAAYGLSRLFLGYSELPIQAGINIVLALLLAFIFQPIKKFFDRVTNRIFFRETYDSNTFFKELNRLLTTTNELRSLLTKTATYISTTLKSTQAFFFVYTNDSYHSQAGTPRHSQLPSVDARVLAEYAAAQDNLIIVNSQEIDQHIHRLMTSHRIAIALPLLHDDKIIGFLCLGESRNSGYTRRDLRILQTIADELVIAIQNALSVHQVRELNETLQQRINAATRELRASNAQLQRLDEAKDEFISMASHQLRTPLTSIKGYISMIVDGDAGKISEQQKHLLNEAFLSSERMVRLIGEFLNVSRLQTGKFTLEKHATNLVQVIKQEIEGLQSSAQSRNLKLSFVAPKNFPLLDVDESKIRQVIMNFSDNAIYYSKENSTIRLSLKVDGPDVVFTVKDTGIGVPADQQASLFNKFFRATNARQQRPDGTGVGLFLAKKVVDAHHGTVLFESKESKGSTFGFKLPLSTTTMLPSEQSQQPPK